MLTFDEIAQTRVEVYFNLHRRLFSVRALSGPHKGRVVAHLPSLTMRDVQFVSQPAGRAKVRQTGVKTVHAFARGTLISRHASARREMCGVTYDPRFHDSFVWRKSETPCYSAQWATMCVTNEKRARMFAVEA